MERQGQCCICQRLDTGMHVIDDTTQEKKAYFVCRGCTPFFKSVRKSKRGRLLTKALKLVAQEHLPFPQAMQAIQQHEAKRRATSLTNALKLKEAQARELAKKEKLPLQYAENVISKRWTLHRAKEAVAAQRLVEKGKLRPAYAQQVIRGKCSLDEAKRRHRYRQRKEQGKSLDIYSLNKRLPGSFESRH